MSIENLLALVQDNVYLLLAFAIFIDTSSLFMTMPGQLVLVIMGQQIHQGKISPLLVLAIAIPSGILGGSAGYWYGRVLFLFARPLFRRLPDKMRDILTSLESQNVKDSYYPIIPLAMFAYGLEWLTSIAPGFIGVNYLKYLRFQALGVCAFVLFFVSLGYVTDVVAVEVDPLAGTVIRLLVTGVVILLVVRFARRLVRQWMDRTKNGNAPRGWEKETYPDNSDSSFGEML